jgi:hypothetical protein
MLEAMSPEPGDRLDRRPILLAVAVATVGMLPPFLTGGLAVQMRAWARATSPEPGNAPIVGAPTHSRAQDVIVRA